MQTAEDPEHRTAPDRNDTHHLASIQPDWTVSKPTVIVMTTEPNNLRPQF